MIKRSWLYEAGSFLKTVGQALADLLFPQVCQGCSSFSRSMLCPQCREIVVQNPVGKYRKGLSFVEDVFSLTYYNGLIQKILVDSKFKGNLKLLRCLDLPLSDWLENVSFVSKADYWVSIPLHQNRLKKRGFNQVDILFDFFQPTYGQKNSDLIRVKATQTLFDLSPAERRLMVQNAFVWKGGDILQGKTVVLLDDILTTGATLSEAARVLKQAGAETVYGITLCYAS